MDANFLEQLKQLISNDQMEENTPYNENKVIAQTVRDRLTKLVAQEGNFNSNSSELGASNNPNRPVNRYHEDIYKRQPHRAPHIPKVSPFNVQNQIRQDLEKNLNIRQDPDDDLKRRTDLDNYYKSRKDLEENLKMEGGIDIVKGITSIFPNTEFHLRDQGDDGIVRKASFCGPGTKLDKRLENFNPQTGEYTRVITDPINQLDKGCMLHDIEYSKHSDKQGRHDADRELIKYADKVLQNPKSTTIQKRNANIVKAVIKGKLLLGVGSLIEDQNYLEDRLNKIIRNDNYANISSSQTDAGKGSMQMNKRQWKDRIDQIIREEMEINNLTGGCNCCGGIAVGGCVCNCNF